MQDIQIGRVYRHFKGDYYLVEGVAQHSETGSPMSSIASSTATVACGSGRLPCFSAR